ncbi:MAG: hypothetical protein QMB25_04215 [Pseudomonadales bacterium]|jgi:hypothetical protein|tara:strand:+ start:845 stop:1438 length:594 start_codon:yes stop_codon:yes gene_type:complete
MEIGLKFLALSLLSVTVIVSLVLGFTSFNSLEPRQGAVVTMPQAGEVTGKVPGNVPEKGPEKEPEKGTEKGTEKAPGKLAVELAGELLGEELGEELNGELDGEVQSCDALDLKVSKELGAIQACQTDSDCGQVLKGSSCGCTRNAVARIDADVTNYFKAKSVAADNACGGSFGISICDCPQTKGFACVQNTCSWNYL